jgi:HlyD family secretion protein
MATNGKQQRWVILALAAGLAVVLVVVLASRGQGPPITVVKIGRSDLNAVVTSNGKVEPVSPAVAHAEFPAFVDHVYVTEGQTVRRGQLILTLDASDIRSHLAQTKADLLSAQSDLRNAQAGGSPEQMADLQGNIEQAKLEIASLERNHKALEDLVAKQAATQDELAQNEAKLTSARAKLDALNEKKKAMTQQAGVTGEAAALHVKQDQDQVQALEEKLRSAQVVAPSDGTVYSLTVRTGDYVNVGQVLAETADLKQVRVRAFVDEPDLGWLEPGQEVHVTWDGKPGETWNGETQQIPKEVVPRQSRSVGEVLCSVDNSNLALLPNVNVEVKIVVRQRKDAIVVPRAAVHYEKRQPYVFVFSDDKVHRRNITIGIASATDYEVLAGLSVDDRVALVGDATLRNGMDVRAVEAN